MEQRHYKEASEASSAAMKLEPHEPYFLLMRAFCLRKRGFLGDAAKDYYAWGKKVELKLEGDAKLADDCLQKREFDQARKYCGAAIKENKDAIAPRIVLIEVDEVTGKTKSARRGYAEFWKLINRTDMRSD